MVGESISSAMRVKRGSFMPSQARMKSSCGTADWRRFQSTLPEPFSHLTRERFPLYLFGWFGLAGGRPRSPLPRTEPLRDFAPDFDFGLAGCLGLLCTPARYHTLCLPSRLGTSKTPPPARARFCIPYVPTRNIKFFLACVLP